MASDDDIPRSLQLLWGRAQRPRRGPRPALRLERKRGDKVKPDDDRTYWLVPGIGKVGINTDKK